MEKKLIKDFFMNTSLEGKELVENLCVEIQQLVVKCDNDKFMIQQIMLERHKYLDYDLFELLYNISTLYLN